MNNLYPLLTSMYSINKCQSQTQNIEQLIAHPQKQSSLYLPPKQSRDWNALAGDIVIDLASAAKKKKKGKCLPD